MKIVGNTVGMGLPKPNLKQTDPRKGDFVKGKDEIPTKPEDIGAQPAGNYALKTEIPAVPVQSVNGKTGEVKLTAADVGARSEYWLPGLSEIGALPASTKIPTKVSELKNDAGYLTEVPEEYAKKEDIPTKPSDIGAVATVNGVAPDDNGNVELASATHWDDIHGKPFGETYGDTLTWDGNIYGLTGSKFSYDFAGMLYNVTKWDYEPPTAEEFSRATITVAFDTGWEQDYTDLGVIAGESGRIEIITSNATSGGTFPLLAYLPYSAGSLTSGLYLLRTDAGAWVKTVTIPGCTKLIKTDHLNAKYLPEVEAIGDVWVKDLKERIGVGADTGAGGSDAGGSLSEEQMEAVIAAVKASFATETWTFTMADGSIVEKKVYVE